MGTRVQDIAAELLFQCLRSFWVVLDRPRSLRNNDFLQSC
jgi:hypothetical protein